MLTLDEAIEDVCINPKDKMSWQEWMDSFKLMGVTIIEDKCGFMETKIMDAAQAAESIRQCVCKIECEPSIPQSPSFTGELVILEELPKTPESEAQAARVIEHVRAAPPAMAGPRVVYAPPKKDFGTSVESAGLEIVRSSEHRQLTIEEWRQEYTRLSANAPLDTVLETDDGSPIRVEIELQLAKPPFLFTRAYIPNIVGARLGWFAQKKGDVNSHGWKLVLLPKSRDEAVKRYGIARNTIYVQRIKVIKMSGTQRSLLGEITEWNDDANMDQ